MNIHDVVRQLTDGLKFSKKEMEKISNNLLSYKEEKGISFEQLNEECWEDSDRIFNIIF